jgi:hypothetical protein
MAVSGHLLQMAGKCEAAAPAQVEAVVVNLVRKDRT